MTLEELDRLQVAVSEWAQRVPPGELVYVNGLGLRAVDFAAASEALARRRLDLEAAAAQGNAIAVAARLLQLAVAEVGFANFLGTFTSDVERQR